MRIGGFLIGVLMATALLSVLLDVPELNGVRNLVSDLTGYSVALPKDVVRDGAASTDPARPEADVLAAADDIVADSSPLYEEEAQEAMEDTVDLAESPADTGGIELPSASLEELAPVAPAASLPDTTDEEALLADIAQSEPQWQIFWSPFRSTRSATGFAERLARLTGLEITVLEERRGRHYVAFAYRDELQRDARYALLERSTGLHITRQGQ